MITSECRSRAGGCDSRGWWCLGLQLCLPAVPGLWAAPRISENKNELMTVPLMPSEDGVFPMSQIFCLPSSLQAQQNVRKGHFCCLFGKKIADYSVSDRYTGKFLKLVIAVRS